MLRSDFRFEVMRWPQRLVAFALGESWLGFLAIVAVGLTLFPMLFAVSPSVHARLDAVQWTIVAWFAVEYVVALVVAPSKKAFLRDPWRWVDLTAIVVPLATLLPNVSDALLSSPVLRLVRLARLVTLGVRVSGVAVRQRVTRSEEERRAHGPAAVVRAAEAGGGGRREGTWDEVLRWARAPGAEWWHVGNPRREELAELGRAIDVPAGFLENHLLQTSYPHLVRARKWTGVFLWLGGAGGAKVASSGGRERHGVLFLFSERGVLSLARRGTRVVEEIAASAGGVAERTEEDAGEGEFRVRVLRTVLSAVVRQNETLVGRLEEELRALEEVPVRESSPAFFERTFRVKKELSAAQADLWRFKGVLADAAAGRVVRVNEEAAEELRRLTTEAEYLYETAVNVRDEVLSVLELHLNVVSFDMNRVMRVLAVVSVLGLIPAVIGGLFGMNLVDNPWPFTLPQVAFAVCFGMVLCIYLFFVKGWLR